MNAQRQQDDWNSLNAYSDTVQALNRCWTDVPWYALIVSLFPARWQRNGNRISAQWQQNFSAKMLCFLSKAFDLGGATTKVSVLSASGGTGKICSVGEEGKVLWTRKS